MGECSICSQECRKKCIIAIWRTRLFLAGPTWVTPFSHIFLLTNNIIVVIILFLIVAIIISIEYLLIHV